MNPTSCTYWSPLSDGLVEPGEDIRSGIWPRSIAVWMAALYVALFIIRPWEELVPWLATIRFERCYALAMISVLVLARGVRLRCNLQTVAVMAFLTSMAISSYCAWNPETARELLYRYFTLVVFYVVLISVIRTPYELVFMVACYIVAMGTYLAKSQWEFWLHGNHRYDQGVNRLVGIESSFGGPNNLAMSIVVSLPMLLFLYKVRKEFCREWTPGWQKWFSRGLAVYLALAVSSLVLTNSRSGMLGGILFVGLVTMSGRGLTKKIVYVLVGAAFLLLIWTAMPEESRGRFRTIWSPEAGPINAQESAQGRPEGFRAAMTIFQRFPVTGVGVGSFVPYRRAFVDGVGLNAHNLPGQLMAETGILGTAGFLVMVGATLLNCRRLKSRPWDHECRTLQVFSEFGVAARNAILLLAFEGIFGHNVYRYNWLWLAAFCLLASEFAMGVRGTRAQPQ